MSNEIASAHVDIVGFDMEHQTVTVQFPYPIINDGFKLGQAAMLRWVVHHKSTPDRMSDTSIKTTDDYV